MQQPIQITFKNLERSEELTSLIHEKANKLQQFSENMISCHITIEQTQRHKQQGKLNNVRIKLNVPGKELVVNNNENENLHIAIRDAFDDMRRQLENYSRKIHDAVKHHPAIIHGKVIRLFEDFGFIEGMDGNEYYFNVDNLLSPKYEKLQVGTTVRFTKAIGNEGLQAHRVSGEHQK